MPDLTKALRAAPPAIQRRVFEAFELQIRYDKAERRIEISATVSEAVASAFENKRALPKEGSLVVLREVAGARFVPRYDALRNPRGPLSSATPYVCSFENKKALPDGRAF